MTPPKQAQAIAYSLAGKSRETKKENEEPPMSGVS
jgi:hypothetical protein